MEDQLGVEDSPRMIVNKKNLWRYIAYGWLPIPRSIIPPDRPFYLWNKLGLIEYDASHDYDGKLLDKITEATRRSLQEWVSADRVGVWVSGGIDSSLMLKAVSDVLGSEKVRAYCLDFGSRKESPEAKRIADWCNVKLVTKEMTPQDNIALTEEAVLRMRAPVDLSPVLFLSKLCKEDGTTKVISALGLDEIQGGYVPHVDSSSSDFPRIETDLLWRAQSYYVWLQMKQSEGCVEVKFPYLDAELIAFCRGLPRDQKCAGRETKVRIRKELRARKFIPAENIEAGRIAGTKAGFIPILKDWFDRGLADWTAANIPPQEVSLADRLVFRYLLIRGRTLEGKLQRRLRVATINAFNKLFDEGRFAR